MTAAWRWSVCLAFLIVLPLSAQFSDVTEVTAVEIPVQVLLDGKPVRDLKAESFVVYQDKQKQPLIGFEAVDLYALPAVSADRAQEVPAPARRHFLLLFDMAFSEPKAIVQARAAAKDLLAGLHPTDLVAVATYASSHGTELVLGFTPDRAQVLAAIDSLGLPELVDRTTVDPLRIVVEAARQEIQAADSKEAEFGPASGMKSMGDAIFLEMMEQFLRESEKATLLVEKSKITSLTRSFADLARLMRSVSGRKHVVYLSEGYDSSILLGTASESDRKEMQELAEHGRGAFVDADKKYGNTDMLGEVESMLEELRRADCVVQAVDIGGLRGAAGSKDPLGFQRKGGKESLFQMAHDTGGDLYENFNDLSEAMGQMLERTGMTYVLTIQPAVAPDGEYHPLRVELRGGPKGARLVYRPGYFAPKPFAQRTRMERMLVTAGQVLVGGEGGAVLAKVMTAAMPGNEGIADVAVLVEIDGRSLLHLHQGNDLPAEIYVYALDEKGQVRDYIAQTLALDLSKVEGRLLQAGLRFYGHLELPPGRYAARVLVRNGRTGQYGLKVETVEVPSSATAAPLLPPSFFPASQGQWLLIREASRPGRREVPIPFQKEDPKS
jgi:VWFA-related protein